MSDKNKYRYHVVEFEDEVHLVPRNWLSDDSTQTYWPNFSSQLAFERAVSNMVCFQENWNLFTIKKVIAVTNNFEKGKRLLELAGKIKEDSSDNEDYESSKIKRRRKQPKQYSSYEGSECNSGNITPKKTSRKLTQWSSLYSVSKCTSDLIDELLESPREEEGLLSPNSSRTEGDLQELHTIIVRAFSEMKNIGKKIDKIVNAQAEISNKLDFLWRQETRHIVENCDNLLLLNVSSLKTLKALSNVEEKLADSEYRLILFDAIERLGITDVKSIVEYVLEFVLANLLDEEYLWLEMDKFPLFLELRLFLIIADVVRFLEPKATAIQISNGIRMWLTQIKLIREHQNSNSFTEQGLDKEFIINKDVENSDENIDGKNLKDDNNEIAEEEN